MSVRCFDSECDPLGILRTLTVVFLCSLGLAMAGFFYFSGVLLRKLMGDPNLEGISHIVVDEIHERGMNEDFLLIVLKSLLQKRENLRLILMSATLNAKLFSEYFGGAPSTHIPGFTFPVQEFYLEDALETTGDNMMPMWWSGM